jgi:hypothetical protein
LEGKYYARRKRLKNVRTAITAKIAEKAKLAKNAKSPINAKSPNANGDGGNIGGKG